MSTEPTFDPSTTPIELSSSLTQLESALSPLLAKEWSAQMEGMDPLERAKMDVMIAYTIVDLIWGMSSLFYLQERKEVDIGSIS